MPPLELLHDFGGPVVAHAVGDEDLEPILRIIDCGDRVETPRNEVGLVPARDHGRHARRRSDRVPSHAGAAVPGARCRAALRGTRRMTMVSTSFIAGGMSKTGSTPFVRR